MNDTVNSTPNGEAVASDALLGRWARIFETDLGQILVTKDTAEGDDGEDEYGIVFSFYPVERIKADVRISSSNEAKMHAAFENVGQEDAVKIAIGIREKFLKA